jgi:hypothetical protein
MNIHFSGMKGLDNPAVWGFPDDFGLCGCGTTQFTIPEAERTKRAEQDCRDFIDGAAV